MTIRRMPDGSYTKNHAEYAHAWREIAAPIEALLPNYVCDAFDPDLRFTDITVSPWRSFSMPKDVALQIGQAVAQIKGAAK